MKDELQAIKYKAERLEAAERLARACDGKIEVSHTGAPIVEWKASLPGGYMFVAAQGRREHASIELWHVPMDLAEQVLKLVVRGSGEDGEDQV